MNPESETRAPLPRGDIGLADVLRVGAALGIPDASRAHWLAEALGLDWKEAATRSTQTKTPVFPEPPVARPTEPPGPGPEPPRRKLKLFEHVGEQPMLFEQFFGAHVDRIRAADELQPATLAQSRWRPDFEPLLLQRWFQGIFTALLATRIPSREIDFKALERSLLRGQTPDRLPLRTRASLLKGVHVLLDRSESMQPFWRDQTELVDRLRRLLGNALVEQSWFEYQPLLPPESCLVWHTPLPRQFRQETPILLVTDFGGGAQAAGRFVDWAPWQPVFQRAESSRSRLFALLPSTPEAWPRGLERFTDGALVWDRQTSPHTAARSCRK